MYDSFVLRIATFFQGRLDPSRPVLLGLSGGPDSLALFYALLDCHIKFHVAHIDHRWREESAAEASLLEQMCAQHGVPFHLRVLECGKPLRNAEEFGRKERLSFFSKVCAETCCQAVLLGHQADDLAENVLKKVFEGASMMQGSGLRAVTEVHGLALWRPLLHVSKSQIVSWLEGKGIKAFDDVTNSDLCYLRGRMRQNLLPMLSEAFGKEVTSGLCAIGAEADDLRDYLDQRVDTWLEGIQKGPWGYLLDLSDSYPTSLVELRHIIRHLCAKAGFVLSKDSLQVACRLFLEGKANGQLEMGDHVLYVDRRRLYACRLMAVLPTSHIPLTVGRATIGAWHVDVEVATAFHVRKGWCEALSGDLTMTIPVGDYSLGRGKPQARIAGKMLGKLWSDNKVPTFLRDCVPVIWAGDVVHSEFLSEGRVGAAWEGDALRIRLMAAG